MKKLLMTIALGALISAGAVQAGKMDGDPSNNKWHITSIKWIKSTDNRLKDDDRWVVLCGRVTKKIDGDTYLFSDGTGTIELDSDLPLPSDRRIVIGGHIDQAWLNAGVSPHGNVDIDVEYWRYERK